MPTVKCIINYYKVINKSYYEVNRVHRSFIYKASIEDLSLSLKEFQFYKEFRG